jgi:hypothetical protein
LFGDQSKRRGTHLDNANGTGNSSLVEGTSVIARKFLRVTAFTQ